MKGDLRLAIIRAALAARAGQKVARCPRAALGEVGAREEVVQSGPIAEDFHAG